ncbi:MAG: hypothetical protein KY392_04955 [Chloroflexi bacterium]|nr:hypothetical protein [Chloroflexota bacterium]
MATNLVRDEGRRDARRRERLLVLAAQEKAEAAVEPEPTLAERAEDEAAARQAVEALTERDRSALLLREEGLDYQEIADALADGGVALARRTVAKYRDELQILPARLRHR